MHQAAFAPPHIFGDPNPNSNHHIRCQLLPQASDAHHRSSAVPLGAWFFLKTLLSHLLAKLRFKADMGRIWWRYMVLLFLPGGEAADHMAPAHRLGYTCQHAINWTRSLIQVLLCLLVQKFLLHLYLNTVFMFNIACNYYSSLRTLSKNKFIPRVIWH